MQRSILHNSNQPQPTSYTLYSTNKTQISRSLSMSTSCHGLITAYVDCLRQTECYKVRNELHGGAACRLL